MNCGSSMTSSTGCGSPATRPGGGDPAALERAAAFVIERVNAAGGEGDVVATSGNPLAIGELRAADPDAPTVLIYGHYDVQAIGDPDAWTSPPFEPDVRDGRVYARGAADDKGNFLPLLHVACALAADGGLPVNVRVLVEGEEESGGAAVADGCAPTSAAPTARSSSTRGWSTSARRRSPSGCAGWSSSG